MIDHTHIYRIAFNMNIGKYKIRLPSIKSYWGEVNMCLIALRKARESSK
jgi:hypothetical protein